VKCIAPDTKPGSEVAVKVWPENYQLFQRAGVATVTPNPMRLMLASVIAVSCLFASHAVEVVSSEQEAFFEARIRPVLLDACASCHGDAKAEGHLSIHSREAILHGGDGGPAMIAGNPAQSFLLRVLRKASDPSKDDRKHRVTPYVIGDFESWIRAGAIWPSPAAPRNTDASAHWAFRPVVRIEPPESSWSEHPIDRFIAAKLREQGLKPVALADGRTLCRRIYFDLTGLPPTPEELDAFLRDASEGGYARLIDRLLASPRYGERWAQHWMDVARYSDTAGDNADYPVPEARLYRDYLIDSFNADKPYDQFVREQLAGDILARQGPAERFAERVIATGFIALSRRYATAPFELMHLTIEDTIETTGRAFMGMTLRCARCHDHKYDPVTKEDYYAIYGFFSGTRYPYAGSEEFESKKFPRSGFIPLVTPDEAGPKLAERERQLEKLRADIKQLEAARERQKGESNEVKQLDAQLQPVRAAYDRLHKFGAPPDLPVAYAVSDDKPVDEAIHLRGEPDQRGPVIRRRAPAFLAGGAPMEIPSGTSGRLQFAEWLTRPENPLTARVMVNRIWQWHFGSGIAGTPSNLGLRGDPPTHPELLDYLAAWFVEHGWSVKALHRFILASKTARLASANEETNAAKDPANKLHWRFDRRRLDAEAIRDAMLAAAGHLDLTRPGPHPFPKFEDWHWTQHNHFKAVYDSNHRGVYLMRQRLQRHPYLALFDAPDANVSTDVRTAATIPLQALYLMNNEFVRQQAAGLARRSLAASGDSTDRIRFAVERAWSRPPDPDEIQRGQDFLARCGREAAGTAASASERELEVWTGYARALLTANEFFFVD
jgi:hypothetical protein